MSTIEILNWTFSLLLASIFGLFIFRWSKKLVFSVFVVIVFVLQLRVLGINYLGPSLAELPLRSKINSGLFERYPIYPVIRQENSKVYVEVLDFLRGAFSRDFSEVKAAYYSRRYFEGILLDNMPLASNESLLTLYQSATEMGKALLKSDPESCWDYFMHFPFAMETTSVVDLTPEGAQLAELKALAEIISSKSPHYLEEFNVVEANASLEFYSVSFSEKHEHASKILGGVIPTNENWENACEAHILFIEGVTQLPIETRNPMLRLMAGEYFFERELWYLDY